MTGELLQVATAGKGTFADAGGSGGQRDTCKHLVILELPLSYEVKPVGAAHVYGGDIGEVAECRPVAVGVVAIEVLCTDAHHDDRAQCLEVGRGIVNGHSIAEGVVEPSRLEVGQDEVAGLAVPEILAGVGGVLRVVGIVADNLKVMVGTGEGVLHVAPHGDVVYRPVAEIEARGGIGGSCICLAGFHFVEIFALGTKAPGEGTAVSRVGDEVQHDVLHGVAILARAGRVLGVIAVGTDLGGNGQLAE